MENNGIMNYSCKLCNIGYVTYNGLWKHNKKYHNVNILLAYNNSSQNISNGITKVCIGEKQKKYICIKCNKEYNNKTSKYKHQKTCVKKDNINDIKQHIKNLEDEMKILKTSIGRKKITNNNNNNGIINNITINKIGSESLSDLTNPEISTIFNKELESIFTFVEMINFNKRLRKNHSFCTTSLESNFLSTFNDETKTIDKERKKYFFDKLLDTSIQRMEILYDCNKNIFNNKKQKQIEENIANIKELKNHSFESKIFKEITNKFNLLSYNKRKIIQKTWNDDPESDGETFQDDLNKKNDDNDPEYIKYIKEKNKINSDVPKILRYKNYDITDDSESE
jgi:hypothetical protein